MHRLLGRNGHVFGKGRVVYTAVETQPSRNCERRTSPTNSPTGTLPVCRLCPKCSSRRATATCTTWTNDPGSTARKSALHATGERSSRVYRRRRRRARYPRQNRLRVYAGFASDVGSKEQRHRGLPRKFHNGDVREMVQRFMRLAERELRACAYSPRFTFVSAWCIVLCTWNGNLAYKNASLRSNLF